MSKYFDLSKLNHDKIVTVKIGVNMGWYKANCVKSSICQMCYDFANADRCTKPKIEGAKIEYRPVSGTNFDDTYLVTQCPYFVYRSKREWERITLADISILAGVAVPILRKMDIENINKLICKNNCECAIIKSQYYIRSINI